MNTIFETFERWKLELFYRIDICALFSSCKYVDGCKNNTRPISAN